MTSSTQSRGDPFGACETCGDAIYDGDPFYALYWCYASLSATTISPEGGSWCGCYCRRCSLGRELGAIELPGGPIDPERADTLGCSCCGLGLGGEGRIGRLELLKYTEVGLHDPEYLLTHHFCLDCFASEGAASARLREVV